MCSYHKKGNLIYQFNDCFRMGISPLVCNVKHVYIAKFFKCCLKMTSLCSKILNNFSLYIIPDVADAFKNIRNLAPNYIFICFHKPSCLSKFRIIILQLNIVLSLIFFMIFSTWKLFPFTLYFPIFCRPRSLTT